MTLNNSIVNLMQSIPFQFFVKNIQTAILIPVCIKLSKFLAVFRVMESNNDRYKKKSLNLD